MSSSERLVQVYGERLNGKKLVVLKAIRYFLERENLAFRNEVFLIDFERQDQPQKMVRKLSQELGLSLTTYDK